MFLYLSSIVPAIWLLELDQVARKLNNNHSNNNSSNENILQEVAEIADLDLPVFKIDPDTWITLIEQFLMLILIVGRWMLPKGDLTRDQLSQLLLVYIGEIITWYLIIIQKVFKNRSNYRKCLFFRQLN